MPPKSPNCYAAENNPKGPYISTVLGGVPQVGLHNLDSLAKVLGQVPFLTAMGIV